MEGLESEVDQLQNVLQSVAAELESGHQQAQVCMICIVLGFTECSFRCATLLLCVLHCAATASMQRLPF